MLTLQVVALHNTCSSRATKNLNWLRCTSQEWSGPDKQGGGGSNPGPGAFYGLSFHIPPTVNVSRPFWGQTDFRSCCAYILLCNAEAHRILFEMDVITSAESYQVPFALSPNGSLFKWPGPYKELFGILGLYWVLIFTVLDSLTQRMSIQSACIQQWVILICLWWVWTALLLYIYVGNWCFKCSLLRTTDHCREFFPFLRLKFHKSSFWLLILAAGGPYWVLISQENGSLLGPYLKAGGSLSISFGDRWKRILPKKCWVQINNILSDHMMPSISGKGK